MNLGRDSRVCFLNDLGGEWVSGVGEKLQEGASPRRALDQASGTRSVCGVRGRR